MRVWHVKHLGSGITTTVTTFNEMTMIFEEFDIFIGTPPFHAKTLGPYKMEPLQLIIADQDKMRKFMLAQAFSGTNCFSLESPQPDGSKFVISLAYLSDNHEHILYTQGKLEPAPPKLLPAPINKHHIRSRP